MIRIMDYLQNKDREENKLDYKNVFKHFTDNFKWQTQYYISEFDECTDHHFKVMDVYIEE